MAKLLPDPFLKKLRISLDPYPKVSYSLLLLYAKLKLSKYINVTPHRTLSFTSYKKLVSLPHFLHDFWRNIFLLLYSVNWPSFIYWLSLPCKIFGNMGIVIVWQVDCDVINFRINFIILIKWFFLHDQ